MPDFFIFEEVDDELQYDAEEYYSSLLRQAGIILLNVRDGNSRKNEPDRLHKQQTKTKIVESLRGYKHTAEARTNMSIASVERMRALVKRKLSADDVREIRVSSLSDSELAKVYDVAQSTIYRARFRITWKHIE